MLTVASCVLHRSVHQPCTVSFQPLHLPCPFGHSPIFLPLSSRSALTSSPPPSPLPSVQYELRSLVQFKIWHETKRDITSIHEHATSGWDRQSMRDCWAFLDLTSRSFAAVIKELDGDLARIVRFTLSSFTVVSCPFLIIRRG
jgi:hypothetical protein